MSETMMELLAGIDVGNGYVKGLIRRADAAVKDTLSVDIPSAVSIVTAGNNLPLADDEVAALFGNTTGNSLTVMNSLDASFDTSLVSDRHRRLFGLRAMSSPGVLEEFDVESRKSKADQQLSKELVLGILAAEAVSEHIREHGAWPTEQLSVSARVALALPIAEYLRYRDVYAAAFLGPRGAGDAAKHFVTIHNAETPVTVVVTFADVQVIAEGASAQYAITAQGAPLMEYMLNDVRKKGLLVQDDITADDVLAAQNTIGVDIGEGTVNFPVFTDGAFNADASTTLSIGYGTVLNRALEAMTQQGFDAGFTSRKQLAAYLQREPTPLKKNVYTRVTSFVDEQCELFVAEVVAGLSKVLGTVGVMTEVIYVYGGGSGSATMQKALHPALVQKVAEMNAMDAFPVLYLDAQYSRQLNREGLMLAATTVAQRARERAATQAEKPARAGQKKRQSTAA